MAYEIILGRDAGDREKFGMRGTILIGKHYVKMGQVETLSQPVYLDLHKAHVIFIAGKRGSGKCLAGGTLITLDDGRVMPIRELAATESGIMSLDGNLKVLPASREGFYRRTVNEVLHIQTRSGRELALTPEHPLLTVRGWQPAEVLGVGSRIAAPRILPAFGRRQMPEHEIKLLAYMIAEGHCKSPLFFTNADSIIVDDFTKAVKDFDPVLSVNNVGEYQFKISAANEKREFVACEFDRNKQGRFVKGGRVVTKKRRIREFFEKHGVYGKLSPEKDIPQAIFTLPKHQLALFLNRLFSCDGSIYTQNGWEVSYASASRTLASQAQHLILRFGVLSKLRQKVVETNGKLFSAYEIVINGDNVDRFIQEIGFFGRKASIEREALEENAVIKRNPNVDTIPKELWDVYRPKSWVSAGQALGYASPKAARSSIAYAPSRQKLLTIAEADCREDIKALASSDIFWDEIVSVERRIGQIEVFDISVPANHNFVANDIIVHNSYALGVIAEGIQMLEDEEIRNRLSVVLLDTMGIYWTMKYANHRDEPLFKDWGLEGKSIPVQIHTPFGFFKDWKEKGIPTDYPFAINAGELNPEDWNIAFELGFSDPVAVFIERVVLSLVEEKGRHFSLADILARVRADEKEERTVRNAAENRFMAAESWGVFSEEATRVRDLAKPGVISVIDLSPYVTMPNGWRIKQLVLGIVSQKLFVERMVSRRFEEFTSVESAAHYLIQEEKHVGEEMPIVWLLIDEAHEFLPKDGRVGSTDALITLLREGRQPGIAMCMATQQPGKIHTDAMTQSDIILAHRLTAKIDTDALGALVQSYLRTGIDTELENLPRIPGTCLAMDDVNERIYPMRIRPRVSWHGGSAPGAVKVKKKIFEF